MPNVDAYIVKFQCPNLGHDLEQNSRRMRSGENMQRPCRGVGANVNADRCPMPPTKTTRRLRNYPRRSPSSSSA